jgi:3-oxoacyl-[acyl-carrier protein] reductase
MEVAPAVPTTALITGSASGLAVAFADRLAAAGHDLILNYRRSEERARALVERMQSTHGVSAIAVRADIERAEDIEQLMDVASRHNIGVLVHAAGPFVFERKCIADYTDDEWQHMLAGNLTSAFLLLRRAVRIMRPQGFGRIVTVGFQHVETVPGWPFRGAYAAAKTGLASLTRTVALEERDNGITANMICPGDVRGADKEAAVPHWQGAPGVRMPVGGDLGQLVQFLVSPAAQFVTGNVIAATGDVEVLCVDDRIGADTSRDPVYAVGQAVHILPWKMTGEVVQCEERAGKPTLYTVQAGTRSARFTTHQLLEATRVGL